MGPTLNKFEIEPTTSGPSHGNPPDIVAMSCSDALAALQVNPATGLTNAQVDDLRKAHGYNEVVEKKGHPILKYPLISRLRLSRNKRIRISASAF
jgi:hypothetical protein